MAIITQKEHWLNSPLEIESIRILGGANYFSGGKVILMRLNLHEYDEVLSNQVPGFYETMKTRIPSLYEHFCSPGHAGGFLERVQEGTLWGHIAEHIAIEVQTLAGMDVSFGKTRKSREPGIYNVIFRYFTEPCGIMAGQLAVMIINSILQQQPFDHTPYIAEMMQIRKSEETILRWDDLVDTAERLHIPVLWNEQTNTVTFGTGKLSQAVNLKEGLIHEWLLRHLFPEPHKSRIPLISVTGTKGKTALLSALAQSLISDKQRLALSCSTGLYIDAEQQDIAEPTGRDAAHKLLTDTSLDLVLLETSIKNILQEGIPYDYAYIGVVLNVLPVLSKELELDRADDQAYAMSVVAEQVLAHGYAILNADDPLVMEMPDRLDCRIIYFTKTADSPLLSKLREHSRQSVVYLDNQAITYYRMGMKQLYPALSEIPCCVAGTVDIEMLLAMTAILIALKVPADIISAKLRALKSN
jgi:hypothetical protein